MKETTVKNGIIILSLLFIGISSHATLIEPVSAATINIQNASHYSNGTLSLSEQIQAILDNASAGDTIKFLGKIYQDLQLTITKKLDIITSAGTKLIGSGSGSAVFLINDSQASGTQINGFNITCSNLGILVNNTSNINISNCNISAINGSAITVNKSFNTTIKNSSITNSITGINVSSSKSTEITGSTIQNNKENGISIENSINTTLNKDKIINNAERGIKIYNSNNSVINGSTLKGNGNNRTVGVSSNEGAVFIKNSNGVKITHNTINDNCQGVTTADSSNVTINDNTITYNYGEGILLNGTLLQDIVVKSNDLEKNGNGIVFNYKKGNNIRFSGNIITTSVNRDLTKDEDWGTGISFGPGYTSTSETEVIEHNAIFNNEHFDMRADFAQVRPNVGSNWYGNKYSICPYIQYAEAMYLKGTVLGANTYGGGFYDGTTGELATDFPSIPVTLTADGFSQTVMLQNGMSIFHVDPALGSGLLTISAYMVKTTLNRIIPPKNNNSSNSNSTTDPSPGGGGGDNPGQGTNGANGGTGGNPSSGTTSGTSSTVGLTAAAAGSAGNTGQSGSDSKKSKTAQELLIDNTVKNPTVWSIIGIIVLLVLIFGAYYRNDFIKMIKKSKK